MPSPSRRSGTFDGWTKNRTKPCDGTEDASIHDPPAASVDMPARTVAFNLKVIGGGGTKSATATQVLEPDGKGGIKTQTFGQGLRPAPTPKIRSGLHRAARPAWP